MGLLVAATALRTGSACYHGSGRLASGPRVHVVFCGVSLLSHTSTQVPPMLGDAWPCLRRLALNIARTTLAVAVDRALRRGPIRWRVRTLLMVGSVALVIGFRQSSALAATYGISVTGSMTITTVLFFSVMRVRRGFRRAFPLSLMFLTFDLAFFSSKLAKIPHGGWFSITLGIIIFTVMVTWRRGRLALAERVRTAVLPIELFLQDVECSLGHRLPFEPSRTSGRAGDAGRNLP